MRRTLLLWLLILALPMQAWAALAHDRCESAPQWLDALVAATTPAAADAACADHPGPTSHHAPVGPQAPLTHHCAESCHACCLAPSMTPPALQALEPPPAAHPLIAWRDAHLPEAPSARLERPPRPVFFA